MRKRFIAAIGLTAILTVYCCSFSYTSDRRTIANNKGKLLVLDNINLIDGTGANARPGSVIFINNGKIKLIGKHGSIKIPSGAKEIDLKGASVLPGFINSHVHYAYDETTLQNWVKGGVTTVRDMNPRIGGTIIHNFKETRKKLRKNPKNAYIVSASSMMTAQGGYGSLTVDSAEDAAKKVLKNFKKGSDLIKFAVEDDLPAGKKWKILTRAEIKAIVDTAHSKKKKVSVHISHAKFLKTVVDAGVDDIAHMVVEPVDDSMIKKVIKKKIYWEPTLELWNGVGWGKIAIDNLAKFYKYGGKVALGTDFKGYNAISFQNGFPMTEVRLMKKAGMSNMDIIVAGTKNAAHVCDMDKEIGTVEAGKKADLLVVKGNPLTDINAFTKVRMVVHNGVIAVNN